jgi:hypothetical protein
MLDLQCTYVGCVLLQRWHVLLMGCYKQMKICCFCRFKNCCRTMLHRYFVTMIGSTNACEGDVIVKLAMLSRLTILKKPWVGSLMWLAKVKYNSIWNIHKTWNEAQSEMDRFRQILDFFNFPRHTMKFLLDRSLFPHRVHSWKAMGWISIIPSQRAILALSFTGLALEGPLPVAVPG